MCVSGNPGSRDAPVGQYRPDLGGVAEKLIQEVLYSGFRFQKIGFSALKLHSRSASGKELETLTSLLQIKGFHLTVNNSVSILNQ